MAFKTRTQDPLHTADHPEVLGVIHTPAGELVVITRSELEDLLDLRNTFLGMTAEQVAALNRRVGTASGPVHGLITEAEEDELAAQLVAGTGATLARGLDVALPAAVWERLEAGGNPVAVLRAHRGLSQVTLAAKAGLSQGYLSQLERNERTPGLDTLVALAKALAVPMDLLIPDHGVVVEDNKIER